MRRVFDYVRSTRRRKRRDEPTVDDSTVDRDDSTVDHDDSTVDRDDSTVDHDDSAVDDDSTDSAAARDTATVA